MNINIKRLSLIVLIIILQVVLDNYCDLGVYLRIVLLPYLILTLPYRIKTIEAMVIAFILGLVVDLFTTGVVGLNSGALAASALVRRKILYSILDERNIDKYDYPNFRAMGNMKGGFYFILPYLAFFIVYILLDNFSLSPFWWNLQRIVICSVVNTIIGLVLFSFNKR